MVVPDEPRDAGGLIFSDHDVSNVEEVIPRPQTPQRSVHKEGERPKVRRFRRKHRQSNVPKTVQKPGSCPWMLLKRTHRSSESALQQQTPIARFKPDLNKPLPPLPPEAREANTNTFSKVASKSSTVKSRTSSFSFDSVVKVSRRASNVQLPTRKRKWGEGRPMINRGTQVDPENLKVQESVNFSPLTNSSASTVMRHPRSTQRLTDPLKGPLLSQRGFLRSTDASDYFGAKLGSVAGETPLATPGENASKVGTPSTPTGTVREGSFRKFGFGSTGVASGLRSPNSVRPEAKTFGSPTYSSAPPTFGSQASLPETPQSGVSPGHITPDGQKVEDRHRKFPSGDIGWKRPSLRRSSFLRASDADLSPGSSRRSPSSGRDFSVKWKSDSNLDEIEALPPTPQSLDFYRVRLNMILNDISPKKEEDDVPMHLPTSPLCPRNAKHKSGGTGTCPMHGKRPSTGSESSSIIKSSQGSLNQRELASQFVKLELADQRPKFDLNIPKHPAGSPLCPATFDNTSGVQGVCVYHGRVRRADSSNPLPSPSQKNYSSSDFTAQS